MGHMDLVYLDNEKWLFDGTDRDFCKFDGTKTRLAAGEVERSGLHFAHLEIAVIKGYPYYNDTRLREFRRVGEPAFVITYDQFDLLDEKDQQLTFPIGETFKKVMAKETAYWKRRRGREVDGDRG